MKALEKLLLGHHKLLSWWQKSTFHTTNCGVDDKNSPLTPKNVVQRWLLGGTTCKKSPMTPLFVVSKVKFCHQYHNLWCQRRIFATDTTIYFSSARGFAKQKVIWKTFYQIKFFIVLWVIFSLCLPFLVAWLSKSKKIFRETWTEHQII